MKLRIMVTGRNRKIASDICDHLESDRGYTPIKCSVSKGALFDMTLTEMPHVIIICTGNEDSETVKVFDILRECTKAGFCRIIVITNDEDRKTFINNTNLKRMYFIARPVSLLALYTKLEEIEHEFGERLEKGDSLVTEFVNENADRINRKHILVVDDDPEQLAVMKEQLSEFYEVSLVNKGSAALRFLEKQHRVDLILLDYIMPDMDGPEVLKLFRSYPEYKDIPVVFLTGVSDREAVTKTLVELKPQGYILKPSKKSEVVAKIIDVLG